MTRRALFITGATLAACPVAGLVPLDYGMLPESAQAMASDLGLGESRWAAYREAQHQSLRERIDQGSAEHVTYYVLQSRRFTQEPPLDPVRLAATRPTTLPAGAQRRFADFSTRVTDARHQMVRGLFAALPARWTPEACFQHTMTFLAERTDASARDALYQRRGLSSDTNPAQTRVLDRALARLRQGGRTLLCGPGLDLTRREGFRDETPLRSYQVERLLGAGHTVDCVDVRPEVLDHLKTRPVCASFMDLTTTAAAGPYQLAVATNLLLYLDERALFAAMAGLAHSLAPGGHLLHNDQRFAAKAFGEVLGLAAIHFEPLTLGRRQGVEQLDRVVLHRKV